MAQLWSILVPEAGTNIMKNGSAERDGNYFFTGTGAGVSRSNDYAYSGFYSFFCSFNVGDSVRFPLYSALENAEYTVSLAFKTTSLAAIGGWTVSVNNANFYSISADFTLDDGIATDLNMARYYRTFSASECNGNTDLYIKLGGAVVRQAYFDAIMVQKVSYLTTYIDGDIAGCYWTGERHASSSVRTATARSGGRWQNFDNYGLIVSPVSNRMGMPPIFNNIQQRALQPGAEFVGSRILPREISLTTALVGTSLSNLHNLRQAVINLLMPDPSGAKQPVVLAYTGADTTRRICGKFHYTSGLEFGGANGFSENQPLRLLAVEPFWYEMGNILHSLSFNSGAVSYTHLTLRTQAGLWTSIGGLNDDVRNIAIDYARQRVYICGAFTTGTTSAGAGQTLNRVAYWDGQYLNPMGATGGGGTIGVSGGVARGMVVAPNGDVWVVGEFTTAGGATATKIAKWNVATDTWTGYNLTTGGGTVTAIYAVAMDKNGLVYIGGDFTDLTGNASADYIAAYDGTTVTALSSGAAGGTIRNVIVASDGNVYATGTVTSIGGVTCTAAKWNGTAWSALLSSFTANSNSRTMFEGEDGTVYVAGANDIRAWNGNSLVTLYDFGVAAPVGELAPYLNDTVLVSLTAASTFFGGSTYHLVWNKTTFVLPDWLAPSGGQLYTQVIKTNTEPRNDVSVIGAHNGVTITSVGQVNSVTLTGTADTYPVFLITGPTTAASSCRVKWIENFTTGERIYLSLLVNTGEYAIVDCRTGVKSVFTSWSGRPGPTPPALRNSAIGGGGLNAGALRGVNDNPLPGSNFSAWNLAPGTNSIGVSISGTVTGVTCIMGYTPTHLSVDGVA